MATTPIPAEGTVGIFEGIDIDAYHQGPGISTTGLKLVARAPQLYFSRYLDPQRPPVKEETAAQLVGNLLHCALLEPAEFNNRFALLPEDAPKKPTAAQWGAKKPSPESIAAMDWWTKWGEDHAGKTTISEEQYSTAWAQADSLRRISIVKEAMSRGGAERSAYGIDPATGLYCRVRPDWTYDAGGAVVLLDAKTYSNMAPSEFAMQCARMGYHQQDAFYRDVYALASGKRVSAFLFAGVETEWPYAANVIELKPLSLDRGRELNRRALSTLKACHETGAWPGYTTGGAHAVDIPDWALKD